MAQQSYIFVQGGTHVVPTQYPNELGESILSFYIGKYETSWEEWVDVRDWANANSYDLSGPQNADDGRNGMYAPPGQPIPSSINVNDLPVISITWYSAVKWCNAKSEKEGRVPVYYVNNAVYRTGNFIPTSNYSANGYRLPFEVEWEWAAKGGILTQGFLYSGSNNISDVAWVYPNIPDGMSSQPVGTKAPNELGIYDMSGNVKEWCALTSGQQAPLKPNSTEKVVSQPFLVSPLVNDFDMGFRTVYIGNAQTPTPSVTPTKTPTPTPSVTPTKTPTPPTPPTPPNVFDVFKKGNEDGYTRFKRMRLLGYV